MGATRELHVQRAAVRGAGEVLAACVPRATAVLTAEDMLEHTLFSDRFSAMLRQDFYKIQQILNLQNQQPQNARGSLGQYSI